MKSKLIFMSLCLVAAFALNPASAQKTKGKKLSKEEKAMMANKQLDSLTTIKQFCFVPRKVPGTTQVIAGYNEMRFDGNKIDCDIPFYGVGEGAFAGNSKNPLKFVSEDFTYVKQNVGTEGTLYMISVNVKSADTGIVYKIIMEVFDDQTAQVSINPGAMRPVGFIGDLTPIPVKKKGKGSIL